MEFDWKVRTLREWRSYYNQAIQANWMQTWSYAQASLKTDYLKSRLALILIDHVPVGMMCIQEIKVGFFHIINLKRGPLWFQNPSAEMLIAFAETFRREFPKSYFQRLRWIPEFNFDPSKSAVLIQKMQSIGFKARTENYVTAWVDLNISEQDLKTKIQQKWRNCLNASLKNNIQIVLKTDTDLLPEFMEHYQTHVQQKKYKGASVRFLSTEISDLAKTKDVFFLWAYQNDQPVAGMCVTIHGRCAAYRVGWNTSVGRQVKSHYLLIWTALNHARQMGLKSFDLGGLLPDDAPGITHFKNGLNGQLTTTTIFS